MRCKETDCFNCKYDYCINVGNYKKRTPEQAKRDSERRKAKRAERIKSGLCIYCGKRSCSPGYKTCIECRIKMRSYKEDENRRKGILPKALLDGVERCQKCGRHRPVNGYKLCKRCLANARAFLDKTPTHNGKKQTGGFTDAKEIFWANKKQKESQ